MSLKTIIFIILTISFSHFTFATQAAPVPNIPALLAEISEDTQKGALADYTYTMKLAYSSRGRHGMKRKFTRVYEAILPSKYPTGRIFQHPMLLVMDSERDLTERDINETRKQLVLELEAAEAAAEKTQSSAPEKQEKDSYWTIGIFADSNGRWVRIDLLKLIQNADFSFGGSTNLDGRPTIVLNFQPRANATLDASLAYIANIEGTIWVDEADKRVVRVEGYPHLTASPPVLRGEPVFFYKQAKVAEGFWFPDTVRLDFSSHPAVFHKIPLRAEFTFSNYRRSRVDVESGQGLQVSN